MDDEAAAAVSTGVETMESSHLSSAAAFVEGGIQEACDDACSICLEAFCDSDPSTVTGCKHEFHLQCILEWCQRSSQCPMCWQPISFKDPTSQELLEGVERERTIAMNRARNTTIFHHPTLGDFELQHLPVGATDAELEERIFQHLAAAAAMGRAHLARRDGRRGRSGSHGRPQYLVFSADPNAVPVGPVAASSDQRVLGDDSSSAAAPAAATSPFVLTVGSEPTPQVSGRGSSQNLQTSPVSPIQGAASSNNRSSSSSSNQANQDRAGPSDFQSFSESLKSRFAAVSTKYKESLVRSTRGWKERLFSRSTSVSDIGSEVRREMNAGIATVSRMMERFETRENSGPPESTPPHAPEGHAASELPENTTQDQQPSIATEIAVPRNELDASTSCVAPSGSN